MITIVLTYRNRDLRIVKNCLDSLQNQTEKSFEVILVDYGSEALIANQLAVLVTNYTFIKLITCPVQGQLWNKSRAINIALKQTTTPYFLVGDIDLIFHPDFMKIASKLVSEDHITYFQYGFLSKQESLVKKDFVQFKVGFIGNKEVTGTTLFPAQQLKLLNGYDEFYHGWGAEDTDIHIRIKQLGLQINFYDSEVIVKHQWHPKAYRSINSTSPFHSKLERINHAYMNLTQQTKRTQVNLSNECGKLPTEIEYQKLLNKPDYFIKIEPIDVKVAALIAQLKNFNNELIHIQIKQDAFIVRKKQFLKKIVGKKHHCYLEMQEINNRLLEEIIINYRNLPYAHSYDRNSGIVELKILF